LKRGYRLRDNRPGRRAKVTGNTAPEGRIAPGGIRCRGLAGAGYNKACPVREAGLTGAKDGESMSIKQTVIAALVLAWLVLISAFSAGCNIGSTSIRLEGMSLGAVTMDNQPIQGLPSDKIDLLLQVDINEIVVTHDADRTTLTLNPSGATVEIAGSGIVINGIKPEQVKVEWAVTEP